MKKNSQSELDHTDNSHPKPKPLGLKMLLLKSSALALLFFVIMMLLTIAIVGIFFLTKANKFIAATPLTWTDVRQLAVEVKSRQIDQRDGPINFLILGVDSVANKPDAPQLTDTIILASLHIESGQVDLISLPRDLWSEAYQTKINALYHYGQQKNGRLPEEFPTQVISDMTGVPINYTVIISLETVADLVDAIDGVSVQVDEAFVDEEFPRSDVDVTATSDPDLLYKTIVFDEGEEHMSGERVLEYIRSRHSAGDTGTDVSRSQRQQAVIASLANTLIRPSVLLNPQKAAQLYNLYDSSLANQVPLVDLLVIAKTLIPVRDNIQLQAHQLSISSDEEPGVIEHPPVWQTQDQWAYVIVDEAEFQEEIQQSLGIK